MTRWHGIEQADGVAPDGPTDRTGGPRRPDLPRDLAVARGPAPRDASRPPRGRAGPTPGGQPGRRRRRGASAGPPSSASSAATRLRGGAAADRRRLTSRAISTSTPRRLREVRVERRFGRQPARRRRHRAPWRRGGTDPRDPGSWCGWRHVRAYRRVSHSRPDAILPGSMNDTHRPVELTPADRGHDLRVVRQPDRALPAARRRASRRRRVNLATETATIRYRPDVADRTALVGAIEAAGYDVRTRPPVERSGVAPTLAARAAADDRERARAARGLLVRALVSIAVAARDHGRHVRAPDDGPDRPTSTASSSSRPRSSSSGPAAGSTVRRGGRPGTERRTWTRSSRSARPLPGRTACVVTLWPELVDVGRDRAGHLLRLVDDHHRPRPARTVARGAGQGTHGRRHPPAGRAQSDDGSRRRATAWTTRSRSRPSRSATCCASGPATASRSTASWSRAARRSTRRC